MSSCAAAWSIGGGVLLIGVALALAACFASYDHNDPSHNHATSAGAANLLGQPGSFTADYFLQTLGFAACFLPLTLGVWGLFILQRRPLAHWGLRIIGLVACLVFTASWASFVPSTLFDTARRGCRVRCAFHRE